MVWAGFSVYGILDPYFFDGGKVNANTYRELLQEIKIALENNARSLIKI